MAAPTSLSENSRGILFVLGASAGFALTDTCVKLASEDLSIGQIIVVRSLIALPLIVPVAWHQGAFTNWRALSERYFWLRLAAELGATVTFLTALARLDFANATAVLQLIPLAVTAAAAIFLGEKVGVRRWTAIAIGFAATLLIIRPGFTGFSAWSLLALATVACVTMRDLCSRLLPAGSHALAVGCLSLVAMVPLGLAMLPFSFWGTLATANLALCAGSGLFLFAAYVLIIHAMRHGEMAVVAPFRYAIMLLAIAIQIVVFSVWPDPFMLFGSAILVATGLYTFHRERRVKEGGEMLAAQPANRPHQ